MMRHKHGNHGTQQTEFLPKENFTTQSEFTSQEYVSPYDVAGRGSQYVSPYDEKPQTTATLSGDSADIESQRKLLETLQEITKVGQQALSVAQHSKGPKHSDDYQSPYGLEGFREEKVPLMPTKEANLEVKSENRFDHGTVGQEGFPGSDFSMSQSRKRLTHQEFVEYQDLEPSPHSGFAYGGGQKNLSHPVSGFLKNPGTSAGGFDQHQPQDEFSLKLQDQYTEPGPDFSQNLGSSAVGFDQLKKEDYKSQGTANPSVRGQVLSEVLERIEKEENFLKQKQRQLANQHNPMLFGSDLQGFESSKALSMDDFGGLLKNSEEFMSSGKVEATETILGDPHKTNALPFNKKDMNNRDNGREGNSAKFLLQHRAGKSAIPSLLDTEMTQNPGYIQELSQANLFGVDHAVKRDDKRESNGSKLLLQHQAGKGIIPSLLDTAMTQHQGYIQELPPENLFGDDHALLAAPGRLNNKDQRTGTKNMNNSENWRNNSQIEYLGQERDLEKDVTSAQHARRDVMSSLKFDAKLGHRNERNINWSAKEDTHQKSSIPSLLSKEVSHRIQMTQDHVSSESRRSVDSNLKKSRGNSPHRDIDRKTDQKDRYFFQSRNDDNQNRNKDNDRHLPDAQLTRRDSHRHAGYQSERSNRETRWSRFEDSSNDRQYKQRNESPTLTKGSDISSDRDRYHHKVEKNQESLAFGGKRFVPEKENVDMEDNLSDNLSMHSQVRRESFLRKHGARDFEDIRQKDVGDINIQYTNDVRSKPENRIQELERWQEKALISSRRSPEPLVPHHGKSHQGRFNNRPWCKDHEETDKPQPLMELPEMRPVRANVPKLIEMDDRGSSVQSHGNYPNRDEAAMSQQYMEDQEEPFPKMKAPLLPNPILSKPLDYPAAKPIERASLLPKPDITAKNYKPVYQFQEDRCPSREEIVPHEHQPIKTLLPIPDPFQQQLPQQDFEKPHSIPGYEMQKRRPSPAPLLPRSEFLQDSDRRAGGMQFDFDPRQDDDRKYGQWPEDERVVRNTDADMMNRSDVESFQMDRPQYVQKDFRDSPGMPQRRHSVEMDQYMDKRLDFPEPSLYRQEDMVTENPVERETDFPQNRQHVYDEHKIHDRPRPSLLPTPGRGPDPELLNEIMPDNEPDNIREPYFDNAIPMERYGPPQYMNQPFQEDSGLRQRPNQDLLDEDLSQFDLESRLTGGHHPMNSREAFNRVDSDAGERVRQMLKMMTHEKSGICGFCKKVFDETFSHALLLHMCEEHVTYLPYSCPLCQETFNSYELINLHMHGHSDSDMPTLDRPIIKPLMFPSEIQSLLKRKTDREDSIGSKVPKHGEQRDLGEIIIGKGFKCKYCERWIKNSLMDVNHEQKCGKGRMDTCAFCHEKVELFNPMKIHLLREHVKSLPFICRICKEEISKIENVNDHMKAHRRGSSKSDRKTSDKNKSSRDDRRSKDKTRYISY